MWRHRESQFFLLAVYSATIRRIFLWRQVATIRHLGYLVVTKLQMNVFRSIIGANFLKKCRKKVKMCACTLNCTYF